LLEVEEAVHEHVVSDPLASSPAAFVSPPTHAVHALEDTYSSTAHK
jgi:hypothetical protein